MLTPRWSFLLVRGIASVLFGFIALAWPGVTLATLTLVFGAYAFADGVITLVVATKRGAAPHRWLLVLDGLVGIGAGVATAMWPGLTLLLLVMLLGIRYLFSGIVQIATAIALRTELDAPVLYGIGGTASVVLGLVTLFMPDVTAHALVMLLGIYALVFGIAMAVLAFRLRRVGRELTQRFA